MHCGTVGFLGKGEAIAMSTAEHLFWRETLANRRASGVSGDLPVAVSRPTSSEQAFVMQQQFAADYGAVIGWKCGVPGVTEDGQIKWVVAPLYQRELQQGAACALWPSLKGVARVEPEYAYPVVTDVPPLDPLAPPQDLTPAAIDALFGTPKLAFELIQSRFAADAGAQFFDQLADGLFNQGLWLGPVLTQGESAEFALTVTVAGQTPQQFSARHPNAAPRLPLYWLVNFLRQQGVPLRAGQYVITGSFAGVIELPFHQSIRWEFGDEPPFSVLYRNKNEL